MRLEKKMMISVLMGGLSDERDVSFETGGRILAALKEAGYVNAAALEMTREIDTELRRSRPDVIFNALHGTYGEDGRIQGLLDILAIPYTGSRVCASSVGMNKHLCRLLMRQLGISIAEGYPVKAAPDTAAALPFPLVLKENENGSSRGVYILRSEEEWNTCMGGICPGTSLVVEKFFAGREVSVAVWDNEILGDVEIVPKRGFYDYEAKYADGAGTEYVVSPVLSSAVRSQIHRAARDMHVTLGCRGVTRSDFIVTDTAWIMLEINTHPGMTGHSLVPMIAGKAGISYIGLIEKLLEEALADA